MIYNIKRYLILLFVTLILVNFCCCSYSFTGASVPEHLKSIAIPDFVDRSGSGEPDLRVEFTNELIQKFIDDNTLRVDEKINADALLECTVSSLSDSPTVVAGGENVSVRRINITVRVVYKDLVKRKTLFENNFSNFGDYDSTGDIIEGRRAAIETAVDKITEDILLAVVSNW